MELNDQKTIFALALIVRLSSIKQTLEELGKDVEDFEEAVCRYADKYDFDEKKLKEVHKSVSKVQRRCNELSAECVNCHGYLLTYSEAVKP